MQINNIITNPEYRHDFMFFFDVTDGNPNGDPDAGNLPRVDPETMYGLVTDVCIKRKIRDYVDLARGDQERYKIYVQNKGIALNDLHQRAYTAKDIKSTGSKQKREEVEMVRKWMCENFYDIRMFGAVMTTEVNCGQVRGPLQLTFARSVSQITPLDVSITRVAITKAADAKVVVGEGDEKSKGKVTEMGRKALVPYGLYCGKGFFSPAFARSTGVTSDDLEVLWTALYDMWELDRSASRGLMSIRGLYVFSHENPLGNAHAHELFGRINAAPREEVRAMGRVPRSFDDYEIIVDDENLPTGVTLTRLVG